MMRMERAAITPDTIMKLDESGLKKSLISKLRDAGYADQPIRYEFDLFDAGWSSGSS